MKMKVTCFTRQSTLSVPLVTREYSLTPETPEPHQAPDVPMSAPLQMETIPRHKLIRGKKEIEFVNWIRVRTGINSIRIKREAAQNCII